MGDARRRTTDEAPADLLAEAADLRGCRFRQVVMMEIFLGVLLGFLPGMLLCAKYLRREIAANIGPRLGHIERQLETLRAEVNLDATTRLAILSERFDARRLRD
jgi:hypothetical protein